MKWFSLNLKTPCITMKVAKLNIDNSEWIEITVGLLNANLITLGHNMRNSENVKNASSVYGAPQSQNYYSLKAQKNIKGNNNCFYFNKLNVKPGILAVAAINKYFANCSNETVVVLSSYKELADIYTTISEYFSAKMCFCMNDEHINVKEYLKQPEGIFCTSIESFQGAQARSMIIILDVSINLYEPRNYILRALAFAIVIETDLDHGSKQIMGFEKDCDLHQYRSKPNSIADILHYNNKHKNLNTMSITSGVLNKYFNNRIIESLVILSFEHTEKVRMFFEQVSNVCSYFRVHDILNEDKR